MKIKSAICLILAVGIFSAPDVLAQKKKEETKPAVVMKNMIDSFSYAAGMSIGSNMKSQGLDDINGALMVAGLQDVFKGNPTLMTEEMANQKLQETIQAYMAKKADAAKQKEKTFFAENKKRPGVTELPNGLQYEVLKAGEANGAKPRSQDTVVVHYKGTLVDGTEFDNSFKRGEPATFPVGGVIRGWTEILQQMTKGSNWKVYIPAELGYGERGAGGAIPPNSTLIFEIDLIDVKPAK